MKKLKLFLNFIIIILLATSISLLVIYGGRKNDDERLYTIEEAKGYIANSNRRMSIDIYSNMKDSLIDRISHNSYILTLDSLSLELNDINVEVYKMNDLYLHKLECLVPEINDRELRGYASLKIINSSYSVNLSLGPISILNSDGYELLSISHLSVSDTYINKRLLICGLNIGFTNKYKRLEALSIGGFALGRLDLAINRRMPSIIKIKEVAPNYRVEEIKNDSLMLSYNEYFIPVSYPSLTYLRESYITMILDDKKYYLDTFTYKTNLIDIDSKSKLLLEGEIIKCYK